MGKTGGASHKNPEAIEHRVNKKTRNELNRDSERKKAVSPAQTETPFFPRIEEHTAMLNKMPFAAQRENFIMQLHRTYGSRYVQRLLNSFNVRAKLTVSDPNDIYEQEADRVADQVTRSLKTQAQRQTPEEEELLQGKSAIQRQSPEEEELLQGKLTVLRQTPEEEELLQGKFVAQRQTTEEEELIQGKSAIQRQSPEEEEELIQGKYVAQRQTPEEEELLQGKSITRSEAPEEEELIQGKPAFQRQVPEEEELQMESQEGTPAGTANDVERRINSARGSGHPLADEARSPMERAFGADFRDVRVHTDAESDILNRELNARAFTTGRDIFFREGEYSPGSAIGQHLIAHELTHVVQQTGSRQINREDVPAPVQLPELVEEREREEEVEEEEEQPIPEEAKEEGFWKKLGNGLKALLEGIAEMAWELIQEALEEVIEVLGVFAPFVGIKGIHSAAAEAKTEQKRLRAYLDSIKKITKGKLNAARLLKYLEYGVKNTDRRLYAACAEFTERVLSILLHVSALIAGAASAGALAVVFESITLCSTIIGWIGKQLKKFIAWLARLFKKDKKKEYAGEIVDAALFGDGDEKKLASELILGTDIETPAEFIYWFEQKYWVEEEEHNVLPPPIKFNDTIGGIELEYLIKFFRDSDIEDEQKTKVKDELIDNVGATFKGFIY